MAYRNFTSHVYTMLRDTVKLDMLIPTNGATTPVASGIRGVPGAVVTRTGVGTYTIALPAGFSFPARPVVVAQLQLSAIGATRAQILGYNTTTRTLTVQCVTAALNVAAEWPAANADNNLMVSFTFSNSAALPVK